MPFPDPFRAGLTLLALVTLAACDSDPAPEPDTIPIISDAFQTDFEAASSDADLFPRDGTGWTGRQQQPEANRVELSTARSRSGTQSMRFVAVPTGAAGTSKADLVLERLDLGEGDRAWFEFWAYLVGGSDAQNLFVWDLEAPATCTDEQACPSTGSGALCPAPGRRLYLSGPQGTSWASDLGKWCRGDVFRASTGTLRPDQWTRIRIFINLSSEASGQFRVWQDDALVLDATGLTLPRAEARYTRLQLGITANGSETATHELFIDDVVVAVTDPGW
ncbi:MAG: heparin lyase I family protein [Bacteroidota bacterium]